jgi:hypothetical protein
MTFEAFRVCYENVVSTIHGDRFPSPLCTKQKNSSNFCKEADEFRKMLPVYTQLQTHIVEYDVHSWDGKERHTIETKKTNKQTDVVSSRTTK